MEGEENKLTTFSTWTIMLGCNESNIISSNISANLGNSGEAMVKIHKYSVKQPERKNGRHTFVYTFCELVEGEENKLTTFSTWTIMLGCNESNIVSSNISSNLGNSREAMVEIHKYSVKKPERKNGRHTFVLFVS